ncbi:protein sprT [Klebsiella variicola]|nr:protein sprT [Klebsiella variicola]
MRSLREHLAKANLKLERRYAEPTLVYQQRGTSAGTAWLEKKRNSFKSGAAAGKSAGVYR